jgi:hypothetical protein
MKRSFVAMVVAAASLFAVTASGLAATQSAVIDFEGLAAGTIVNSVSVGSGISGDPISGSVAVFGDSADASIATNAAVVFDAACGGSAATCSGEDADLFKPALGKVLIIAEDLVDANNDGFVDDPDDADLKNAPFSFDFSSFGSGTVTVQSIDVLDVEAGVEEPAFIELFDASNALITTVAIPATGNNGLATVNVNVSGVERMVVTLQGSGAIDNIRLSVDVPDEPPGAEGCTPGFWKNHPEAWPPTGFATTDTLESVFDVPDDLGLDSTTLLTAVGTGGGGTTALLRHAVSAVLNAAHPSVDYPLSVSTIITDVNAALASGDKDTIESLKDTLDEHNNLSTPGFCE